MNKPIFALLLLFVPLFADSQAQTNRPIAPNRYELAGAKLHITYSATGLGGQHFSYQDGSQTLSFSGSQIRQTKTEIGMLVMVTLRMTVDSGSTTFALLVPSVNLPSPSSAETIHTFGVTTVHRFSVIPAMNQGQTETYTTTELSGKASLVLTRSE